MESKIIDESIKTYRLTDVGKKINLTNILDIIKKNKNSFEN